MKITVTAKDIMRGKRGSQLYCPIALAVSRTLGRRDLNVFINSVWTDGDLEICRLPVKATDFIMSFDGGNTVKPFTFAVQINRD